MFSSALNDDNRVYKKNLPILSAVVIKDQPVDVVGNYKYLGATIDDKLSFGFHADPVCSLLVCAFESKALWF